MKRPNLFIVGFPKCGTTAWVEYLSRHPQIGFSREKEPHYFNDDLPNFQWFKSLDPYLELFKDIPENKVYAGEASVGYVFSKVAAKNIKAFCPDAKVIIFLRKHLEFLKSYHQQVLLNRDEDCTDLNQAWNLQRERKAGQHLPKTCREPYYLQYSEILQYSKHIARFYQAFPRSQIKIVHFENWVKDPRKMYMEILEFLGLQDDGRTQFEKIHPAKVHRLGWLANITQRHDHWLYKIARPLKSVLGVKSLGVGEWLYKYNKKEEKIDGQLDPKIISEVQHIESLDKEKLAALTRS